MSTGVSFTVEQVSQKMEGHARQSEKWRAHNVQLSDVYSYDRVKQGLNQTWFTADTTGYTWKLGIVILQYFKL